MSTHSLNYLCRNAVRCGMRTKQKLEFLRSELSGATASQKGNLYENLIYLLSEQRENTNKMIFLNYYEIR